MSENANYAVVIISFDGYEDVWSTFFECYNKFWTNRGFNTYLITNQKTPYFAGVKTITTGKEVSWSNRVRLALERIPENNILVLLEDYFLDKVVNQGEIDEIIHYFISNEIDYLRLIPIPIEYKKREQGVYPLDESFVYGVNLQAALWKKDYLQKLLFSDDFSAWEFEARQKIDSNDRVVGKCFTLNYTALSYLNGVIQGKWYPQTIEKLKKLGIIIPTDKRAVIPKKKLLFMDIQNWLLHHIPKKIINSVKPFLVKIGARFVTKD